MKNFKINSCIILFIVSVFSVFTVTAQEKPSGKMEIIFSTKDFTHVPAIAKAQHKKVFVDAYAKWCAPCKELQKTTFKDPKAAAYFNKNFINISIDVEKGEGVKLAKTWKIEGLPTLLILDENGSIMANHIGYVDGTGLLEFAKEAYGK
ncbi:thioredoxin family protein [Flavobacterium sp. N1736]|uniref:thioredoxin family protein n=1 Tax=Flavobacterium sp. N1736 TaxID=2986823 RepID=UPI00222424FC|nr:thioredoxin fold domain-containing protein [Flavobacterium sp. N1736]